MRALWLVLLVLGFAGCANPPLANPAHTSQYGLEWAGVYQGTLPSASGMGLRVHLELRPDGHYTLENLYVGNAPITYTSHGYFSWDATGFIITLEEEQNVRFFVEEHAVILLDQEGNFITGPLKDAYKLPKKLP
ncbi:MAG: copper resistance protein NlpE N-terminal domain-containing protein [Campylobacterales bacterium]|nr:copper resistance protein NlpE N-terminal domain-containing protein [Campylobacterales bacterium]